MDLTSHSLTDITLVTMIAVFCGIFLERLKQPAIVGYIVAGIVLGPTGFGFISNSENVQALAELGIILLLFIIGMELSFKSFMSVIKIAISCVVIQLVASLLICYVLGKIVDWTGEETILFGFILMLSSTAVAIKMLDELGHLKDPIGQITVGILVAQDLALVPMLLMAGSLSHGGEITMMVWVKIFIAIIFLIALVMFLSKREKLTLPFSKWLKGNGDMPPLIALAICFSAATLSGLLGLSSAYGAFLAGLIIANSTERDILMKVTHPIHSVLLVVFFLSIGLMIDLGFIFKNFHAVFLFLLTAVSIKTVLNIAALRMLGQSWENAFPAGLVMAQLGEFAFLLTSIGFKGKILDDYDYNLAISVIALSLLLSPLWLLTVRRFHGLASQGITSARGIVLGLYQGEIKSVSDFYHNIRSKIDSLSKKTDQTDERTKN